MLLRIFSSTRRNKKREEKGNQRKSIRKKQERKKNGISDSLIFNVTSTHSSVKGRWDTRKKTRNSDSKRKRKKRKKPFSFKKKQQKKRKRKKDLRFFLFFFFFWLFTFFLNRNSYILLRYFSWTSKALAALAKVQLNEPNFKVGSKKTKEKRSPHHTRRKEQKEIKAQKGEKNRTR